MALLKSISADTLQGSGSKVDLSPALTAIAAVKADTGTIKTDTGTIKTDTGTIKADVAVIKTNTTPPK